MAHDQQLCLVTELLDEVDEPAQVDVVEGRLDLVQDVEGRGPGPEDGEQEGQGGQRPLTPGEQ
jgi:hypothetical protein